MALSRRGYRSELNVWPGWVDGLSSLIIVVIFVLMVFVIAQAFLQQVLADNPAIEVASDVPPFKFTQWDGKLLREIPRLRIKPGARLDPATIKTGYADMAIESFDCLTACSRKA